MEDKLIQILLSFIFGTLGAGFFSLYKRKKEAKIDFRIETEKRLNKYSNSLWLILKELEYRLKNFKIKLETESEEHLNSLKFVPRKKMKIDWYAKDGYFVTSTLYLFCNLSSWITIYQRDIVFLRYERNSLSVEFNKLIEELKRAITNQNLKSGMWYHYFGSIGELIIDKSENLPLSYSEFVFKLVNDIQYLKYMEQSFLFLNFLSTKDSVDLIKGIIEKVEKAKEFIQKNNSIPN